MRHWATRLQQITKMSSLKESTAKEEMNGIMVKDSVSALTINAVWMLLVSIIAQQQIHGQDAE